MKESIEFNIIIPSYNLTKMKKLAFILTVFCISTVFGSSVFAQQDQEAVAILDGVTKKTQSYQAIDVSFTYTMTNPKSKINESKTGKLILKGDNYRLEIEGQTVISNGKTVWTYMPEAKEVQINDALENPDAITPSKLLTSWNKNYSPKLIKKPSENYGTDVQVIELSPKSNKSVTKVKLIIDKAKQQIKKAIINDKSGSTFTYSIDKFSPLTSVDINKFKFSEKDYPGVEVIDMR